MLLRELELSEFRAFRQLNAQFEPAGVRIVGANASGKSTLLEAITMLATFRSPRTSVEREIANWQSGAELEVPPYARARGHIERNDGRHTIDLALSLDGRGVGALRKQIRFDEQQTRATDAIGEFKTVLFSPDDVTLVAGPPSGRRRFLDIAASQASKSYVRALSRYARVLEQRNSLLRSFSRDWRQGYTSQQAEELAFWDDELSTIAAEVVAVRLAVVHALGINAGEYFRILSGSDGLKLTYVRYRHEEDGIEPTREHWSSPSQAFRQAILASLRSSMDASRAEELRRGVTAVGPHRDDLLVSLDDIDIGRYGSRGQQRLAVIAMKLAELDLLADAGGELPVLLLDDVLSELDARHQAKVLSLVATRGAQVCVTATDERDLEAPELRHLPIWILASGAIEVST